MIRLNVIENGERSERIFQGDCVVIGRSRDCDLVLTDQGAISRRHCQIKLVDHHCEVTDLSSKNGVQIGGIFFKRGILEVGDEMLLGDVRIEVLEFGPDSDAERVRPCMSCGFLIPFDEIACPRCSGGVMLPRKTQISPHHLAGYVLKRKIGAGGMGIVFEAIRKSDRKTTAIKILKPHLAKDPSYLMRFVEETRVLTMLRHPNIVQVYGRGAEKGLVYIDMELVRGVSVRELLRRDGPFDEERGLGMGWDVVRALEFAARKNVVHGDVKPSNFLADERGRVKLCDFGLARLAVFARRGKDASPELSGRKGTAAYAAPERFKSGAPPTVPGDIFGMGVSLFQMLTGQLPFGTNSAAQRRARRGKIEEVPNPRTLRPELRTATCMLIERMMQPEVADRYDDWRRVQDDLALLTGR